ncbi:MAG: hypothetical protein ABFR90_04810 [Planctomycetota bacterium]
MNKRNTKDRANDNSAAAQAARLRSASKAPPGTQRPEGFISFPSVSSVAKKGKKWKRFGQLWRRFGTVWHTFTPKNRVFSIKNAQNTQFSYDSARYSHTS